MMMRLGTWSTVGAFLVLAACDLGYSPRPYTPEIPEVDPDSPLASLFGSWLAHAIEVRTAEDPASLRDLVPRGSVFSFRVDLDATYTRLSSLSGGALLRQTGTLVISDSTLTLVPDNQTLGHETYAYVLTDEALVLDFERAFDVDGDGVEDRALFHIELLTNPISLGNR